jgi:hypothetical protein
MDTKSCYSLAIFPTLLKKYQLVLLLAFSLAAASCSSSKDVVTWNVELKEAEIPITNRCDPDQKLSSVQSTEKPLLVPETEERGARVRVVGVPCSEGEDAPIYEIPINRVKRITYVSDPLEPPTQVASQDLDMLEGCCRVRDGWWVFDKVELRGAIGYRGDQDEVTYPGNPPTTYKSSFFGFDRGGSSIMLGLEVAGLWDAKFIDDTGKFQLGILSGIWPMDGSIFVPLGLHGRYTFNQDPSKYSDNCNTWYLYGNLGLPLDFQTNAPLFGRSITYQRYFYGIGIGYDWAICCKTDFSIDLGLRGMNLPLPPCEACDGIPDEKRNPFRNSTALLLRFGLTW